MTLGPSQEMTLTIINHIPSLVVCFCQLSVLRLQKFPKYPLLLTFSPMYKPVSKTDLAVKLVMVILEPSFEQTMMGWSPRYYISSFMKIDPLVLEKIFWHFLAFVSMAAMLSIRPRFPHKILFPLSMEALHKISFHRPSDF